MTSPSGRIGCCVDGCRRTCPAGRYLEWICAVHWPTVPKALRVRHVAAKAALRRAGRPGADVSAWDAACSEADVAWAVCKDAFEERPFEGLSAFLVTWFEPKDAVGGIEAD